MNHETLATEGSDPSRPGKRGRIENEMSKNDQIIIKLFNDSVKLRDDIGELADYAEKINKFYNLFFTVLGASMLVGGALIIKTI